MVKRSVILRVTANHLALLFLIYTTSHRYSSMNLVTRAIQRTPAEVSMVSYAVVLTGAHLCWYILNRHLRIGIL